MLEIIEQLPPGGGGGVRVERWRLWQAAQGGGSATVDGRRRRPSCRAAALAARLLCVRRQEHAQAPLLNAGRSAASPLLLLPAHRRQHGLDGRGKVAAPDAARACMRVEEPHAASGVNQDGKGHQL